MKSVQAATVLSAAHHSDGPRLVKNDTSSTVGKKVRKGNPDGGSRGAAAYLVATASKNATVATKYCVVTALEVWGRAPLRTTFFSCAIISAIVGRERVKDVRDRSKGKRPILL